MMDEYTEEWKESGMLYVYFQYSSSCMIIIRVYMLCGSSSHVIDSLVARPHTR